MRALRFVSLSEDGTHLVLAPDVPEAIDSGERFTVVVDERLRAASRGDISRLGQIEIEIESQLRPKEIQARIRAGDTPEAVAAAAGIRVERVMRYAYPVLQERQTVAERAQTARVKLDDTTQSPTLTELIQQRLLVAGAASENIAWDSRRLDDGMWEVSSTWSSPGHGGRTTTATWRYDVANRTVFPGNRDTVRLVEPPAPRLVAVPPPAEDPSLDDAQTGPVPLVPAAGGGPLSQMTPVVPVVADEPVPLRRVRGRSRRAERQSDLFADPVDAVDPGRSADAHRRTVDTEPEGGLEVLGFDDDPQDSPDQHEPDDARTPEPAAVGAGDNGKKPRIPSWDDIVFGTRKKR